ncbi:MAG: Tim44 domain-containing protein [Gammaproteobacteria bacterium]|nr:Tim44 domain-containing protein [Gammaproteobacteria bacterium]
MLRTFITMIVVCLVTWGLFIQTAEAKRFGGGRSFGMSRSTSSFSHSNAPSSFGQSYARPQPSLGQTPSTMSRWLGPIAGLVTGGLLASLFMKSGLGGGITSLLLLGGLFIGALFLISLFRNRLQPASQSANLYQDDRNNFARDSVAQFAQNNSFAATTPVNQYPIGFDAQNFLRDAKVQFMRLQAAYDQKNLNDIREFTMPEIFAEIQLQLQERGNEENKTNVMSLEAELLNVENSEMQSAVASVRFTAMIQENNEAAAQVKEIWHFKKEMGRQHWLVAGIQQTDNYT